MYFVISADTRATIQHQVTWLKDTSQYKFHTIMKWLFLYWTSYRRHVCLCCCGFLWLPFHDVVALSFSPLKGWSRMWSVWRQICRPTGSWNRSWEVSFPLWAARTAAFALSWASSARTTSCCRTSGYMQSVLILVWYTHLNSDNSHT